MKGKLILVPTPIDETSPLEPIATALLKNVQIDVDIIAVEELKNKDVTYVKADNRELFVYSDNDDVKVFDSRCPHQATNIPELVLEDCKLTCPKHGWKFDVRNGECIDKGNRPLHEFESRIADNRLEVSW